MKPDRVGLGVSLVLTSTFLVALQDAIIKQARSDITLWQIFVLRSLILIPALLAFGLVRGDGVATVVLQLIDIKSSAGASNYWFITGNWGPMGVKQWGIIVMLAAALFANGLVLPAAYQVAPTTIIITFDYCYLIFATLFGFILFSEVPDGVSIAGMVMIAVAGLVVARRG